MKTSVGKQNRKLGNLPIIGGEIFPITPIQQISNVHLKFKNNKNNCSSFGLTVNKRNLNYDAVSEIEILFNVIMTHIAQNIAETRQQYSQSFIAIEILPQHFRQLFQNISLQHYNFNFLKYFCN